jgi:cytochrome P450
MDTRRFPPGPPVVGTNVFAQLRYSWQIMHDMLGVISGYYDQYGDLVHLQFGQYGHLFLVKHPEHAHQVLVEKAASFHKGPDYKDPERGLARFLGNGLLVSDGEFWKRQRRLVAPALHARRVEAYAETMVSLAERLVAGWRDGAVIDVDAAMMRVTLDIVSATLFSSDVSDQAERVGAAMTTLQHANMDFDLIPNWVPTPKHLRERKALRDLDGIIYDLIAAWRTHGEDRGDLLSMLLLAQDDDGSRMSDQQVRDEAMTLFLAGHETTANALNWTWYLLAQNPDVEAKLHAELDAVLGGALPKLDDLKRLPYTEMVIKESMRLFPPAWGFGRRAIEDVEIGGYTIPAGSGVNISVYHMHRDPRWWLQPERFDPLRFSPEGEQAQVRYAYLPFGGGPRICIGNAFALMEARLLLAVMASRFRLRLLTNDPVEPEPLITLRPKNGLRMRLEARHSASVSSAYHTPVEAPKTGLPA